jgi:SWI/SNF-related matrix-associated actin-dependent regulator of chromatin subfamily A member 5
MQSANSLLQPLMLRRLKVDVESTLPPKTETRLFLPLSTTQNHVYKHILSNEKNNLKIKAGDKKSQASSNTRLQGMMMKLRKCCNHPFFNLEDEDSEMATFNSADPESLIASSSKMVVLDKLLAKLKPDGHKVLIFSQFTAMLDLLEGYCRHRGHKSLRLDGSTTSARRVYEVCCPANPGCQPKFCTSA